MTKMQGWVLIALIALGGGYFAISHFVEAMDRAEKAEWNATLKEHYRQKCVVLNDCADWNRVN